jgi:LDH2 family malate/lactate/ureidoglycolate dehydrogenase
MFTAPVTERRRISHFFAALRIDSFVDDARFRTRLAALVRALRELGEREGQVMAPGDPEKRAFAERTRAGIPMFDDVFAQFLEVSGDFSRALAP